MKRAEAKAIVGSLVAGWPTARVEQATVELYTSSIAELASTEAAVGAVRDLVAGSKFFPSMAEFRNAYSVQARRIADQRETDRRRLSEERGLPEGDRPPIPDDVIAFAAALGTGAEDRGDPLADYEIVGPGECADCARQCEIRVRYGTLDVCYAHALSRLRVRAKVS